jgi:hypothetical protein
MTKGSAGVAAQPAIERSEPLPVVHHKVMQDKENLYDSRTPLVAEQFGNVLRLALPIF